MNNFGFNGLNNGLNNGINNENPLMQYLKQFTQQQPHENTQSATEPQRISNGGIMAFEINSKSDIEYIEPDKSGRKQIYICESADKSENKIYVGRYNHVRKEMDYRAYIDEGEINLYQKPDTSAEMSQIANALVAVVNKLEAMNNGMEAMHEEIQELKNIKAETIKQETIETEIIEPKKEESNRRANGQFKKKGEN